MRPGQRQIGWALPSHQPGRQALSHTGGNCCSASQSLTHEVAPRWPWHQTRAAPRPGRGSGSPLSPRPPAAPRACWPDPALGNWDERRPASSGSREAARLSAAICLSGRDRPGRRGLGSPRPRPPAWPAPGPRGSPVPLLRWASWRQGSGRRGAGGGAADGDRESARRLPDHLPQGQARTAQLAPGAFRGQGSLSARSLPPRDRASPGLGAPAPRGLGPPRGCEFQDQLGAELSPEHARSNPASNAGLGAAAPSRPGPGARCGARERGPRGQRPPGAPAPRARLGEGGAAERASPARLRGPTDAK